MRRSRFIVLVAVILLGHWVGMAVAQSVPSPAGGSTATITGTVNTTIKDSGGGDATDPTNHAVNVTAVTGVPITGQNSPTGVGFFPNCTNQAPLRMSTATTTQLVPVAPASQYNYMCHLRIWAEGTTSISIVEGTGSNCASNQQTLDGPYIITSGTTGPGWNAGPGLGMVLRNATAAREICVTSVTAVNVTVFGTYATF